MKHKVMINAGQQSFEFEGVVVEIEDDHIILQAKHSSIYIERKHLVFIQTYEDVPEVNEQEEFIAPTLPKVDNMAKFVNNNLKKDPVNDKLENINVRFVPPSQLPDGDPTPYYKYLDDANSYYEEENAEVIRKVHGAILDEEIPPPDLRQAVTRAMANTDDDFSMSMSGSKRSYKNPAQTLLGKLNADSKKTRNS
jgi:hypothetical protein